MATLKNWYLDTYAYGIVSGHPKLADGIFVNSTRVLSVKVVNDEGDVEIQTRNTLYKANLKDAIFDNFSEESKEMIDDFDELKEKFKDAYDFPKELLEQEGILIELSRNADCNFVSCLANIEQKMYKELKPSIHLGMFEDSVLLRIRGLDGFDCRYFPRNLGSIEFYTWRTPYKTYIKNSSDIDIEVVIFDFKKVLKPGETVLVPKLDKETRVG